MEGSLGRASRSYSALQWDFKGHIPFSLTEGSFCAYPRGGHPRSCFPGLFCTWRCEENQSHIFLRMGRKGWGNNSFLFISLTLVPKQRKPWKCCCQFGPQVLGFFSSSGHQGQSMKGRDFQILCPSNPSCEVASVWLRLFSITRGGLALKMQLVLKEKPQLAANNNRGILCWMRHLFCGYTQSNFCKEKGLNSVGYSFIWKRTNY